MKKIIMAMSISVIAMFAVTNANGQTANTIVDTNSVWSIGYQVVAPNTPFNSYCLYIKGDSVINNKTYHQVFKSEDTILYSNDILYTLLREENQKTYILYNNTEYLLYDFSMLVGDSMEFYHPVLEENFYIYLDSITDIEMNGNIYKKFYLSGMEDMIWVEKLGCITDELCYPFTGLGVSHWVLCYKNNNDLWYYNPNFDKCYYNNEFLNINTLSNSSILIYPNPASDKITIDYDDKINSIELVDMLGKVVYQWKEKIIDVSKFAKGSYFVKVVTDKGTTAKKIVVE